MKRDRRFPVVLSKVERVMLHRLAQREHIPAAAVVRRLIWREARERGLWPVTDRNDGCHAQAPAGREVGHE